MLSHMTRIAALAALLCTLTGLTGQQTLKGLEQRFRSEAQQLGHDADRDQRDTLLNRHIGELRTFVAKTAKGDDRWNGRLMLADLELVRGKRADASEVLKQIDADQAPAMVLVTAATMAQHLQLKELRDEWVRKAITKQAPLTDRLAMARMLMTVLEEIEHGEKLFEDAIANAKDEEQRAFIMWHRADTLRDREDLPENTGFDELEKLAKALPKTYWGSVAKDRLRATRLNIGDEAIPIVGKTTSGASFSSTAMRGKPLVAMFYTASDFDTEPLLKLLKEQREKHPDLAIVGICLDRDPNRIKESITELGIDFPVIGDGRGAETDAALRWFVEGPVVHVFDKAGKVAGLGMQAGTRDGRTDLTNAIERASR
jgi:hypothetical protein